MTKQRNLSGAARYVLIRCSSVRFFSPLPVSWKAEASDSSGRLMRALATEHALIFSKRLSQIHPSLQVPVSALLFNCMVTLVTGVIYVV